MLYEEANKICLQNDLFYSQTNCVFIFSFSILCARKCLHQMISIVRPDSQIPSAFKGLEGWGCEGVDSRDRQLTCSRKFVETKKKVLLGLEWRGERGREWGNDLGEERAREGVEGEIVQIGKKRRSGWKIVILLTSFEDGPSFVYFYLSSFSRENLCENLATFEQVSC